MADIADVLDALQASVISAIYPNGPGTPSIALSGIGTPIIVNVAQGWPGAGAVDAAMGAGQTLVSISPVNSSTSKQPVPIGASAQGIVTPAVHGMVAISAPGGFTIAGNPGVGEYVSVLVGRNGAYTYSAVPGDTAASVTAALAALVPNASVVLGQFFLIGGPNLTVRIGAPGVGGTIIDRQTQNFKIIVWSPTVSDRTAVGKPIDVAIKDNLVVTMPDTTSSLWWAQTIDFIDKYQDELAYRRDLTVKCQWDTLDTYPVYEITVFSSQQNSGISSKTSNY